MKLSAEKMKKRDNLLKSMLNQHQDMTHSEASKISKAKYGCGISFIWFKNLKKAAESKAFKGGTVPLKEATKGMHNGTEVDGNMSMTLDKEFEKQVNKICSGVLNGFVGIDIVNGAKKVFIKNGFFEVTVNIPAEV